MKQIRYFDPLETSEELCGLIFSGDGELGDIRLLALSIDKFIFSLRWVLTDAFGPIPQSDREPPSGRDYKELHRLIGARYPTLGFYWTALYSDCKQKGEIATGDAIDDLSDIYAELEKVIWFRDNVNRDDGLAALQFAYRHHLYMHVLPLRNHLEEVMFNG